MIQIRVIQLNGKQLRTLTQLHAFLETPRVRLVVPPLGVGEWGPNRGVVMARYGAVFKKRAVARLLPPNVTSVEALSRELGISADTLDRWRSEALTSPARERDWSAAARLDAVLTTTSMDEATRSAWCREHGVFAQELESLRVSATQVLAEPEERRASPKETATDRRRIKELERQLRRKDNALAETAALLVLSKKLEAIFHRGEDE